MSGLWLSSRFWILLASVFLLTSSTLRTDASAQLSLLKLSTDTFTNPSSQHATEVEPSSFAFGSTMVTAFQVGRMFQGGSSDIGFATSTDAGTTWKSGFLPGITTFFGGGTFSAAGDPSVVFDAAHGQWLISSIAGLSDISGVRALVSRSIDGVNWNNPVIIDNNSGGADKDWITCDNFPRSLFFGHCYVVWYDDTNARQLNLRISTDGGLSWSAPSSAPNTITVSALPVVQPNGTVVMPFKSTSIQAFVSTDGGNNWSGPVTVASITSHDVVGGLRAPPLPSAAVDASGKIYVVWHDCRFRSGCASNDIVLSTTTDGNTWSSVARIPIDATGSTIDHCIPEIAVDPMTSGTGAHLTLTFYFYPAANCSAATCKLMVGFVSSTDGGRGWSKPATLAGPMHLNWLPNTNGGNMVGDYIATSYVNGNPFGVFTVAHAKSGSNFDEAVYTTSTCLGCPTASHK